MKCGLLGRKLGHSYSPAIHTMLGDYEYKLYEKAPEELEAFLREGDFSGLNVTIPYKKTVLHCCSQLSPTAAAIGSVNTLLRLPDGSLYGDNTDAYGFEYLLREAGAEPKGEKALILGSGGAMLALRHVLEKRGAYVTVISRTGEDNYENLSRHSDAALIVNATPVGMYPDNMRAPIDLGLFPRCRWVLDIVYNPMRTALLMQAESLGISCGGGLPMLVAQAKRSGELFTGAAIDDGAVPRICRALALREQNIALIGMPGSGKTTVGKALAQRLARPFADLDDEICAKAGMSIPEIFAAVGEEGFRRMETDALRELGKRSGWVIATGGGCVTRPENYPLLRQNSRIVWLQRDISELPTEGRPLSEGLGAAELFRRREPLYRGFADAAADNSGSIAETVNSITEELYEAIDN